MNYLKNETFNLVPEYKGVSNHKLRVLIFYSSLRERSFSRLAAEEAGRILIVMGAEVKYFNPKGLLRFTYFTRDHGEFFLERYRERQTMKLSLM